MRLHRHRPHERGFTLVEALVALALIIVAAASLAQLFVQSTSLMLAARRGPVVLAAALSKIEQLRVLALTRDAAGAVSNDESTDTAPLLPAPAGGTGLQPSPPDTLATDVDGFVDHLDWHGQPLGGGIARPPGTAYVRRWQIVHVTPDVVAVRVCVWTALAAAAPPEACLSAARARRP